MRVTFIKVLLLFFEKPHKLNFFHTYIIIKVYFYPDILCRQKVPLLLIVGDIYRWWKFGPKTTPTVKKLTVEKLAIGTIRHPTGTLCVRTMHPTFYPNILHSIDAFEKSSNVPIFALNLSNSQQMRCIRFLRPIGIDIFYFFFNFLSSLF